jgi:hypothetical protein
VPTLTGPTASDPAIASFGRTYAWNITKTAAPTAVTTSADTTDVTYVVTATQQSATDSAWTYSGTVTIDNPNATPLNGVTVTDAVDNGGSCTVQNGTGITIAANGSATLHYTCTWAQSPSSNSGTDTGTASWDAVANGTPTGTATVDTPFTFASPTSRSNGTVAVVDSMQGALGDLTALDSGGGTTRAYTYTRTLDVPSGGCTTVPNTAQLNPTGQSASAPVEVCRAVSATVSGGPDTGAHLGDSLPVGAALITAGAALLLVPRATRRRTRTP